MRRTKVLYVIDSLAADAGTERQCAELAMRIDREEFEPRIACLESSERLVALSRKCHTAVFPVQVLYRPQGLYQVSRLRDYIRRNEIDIVHAFMEKSALAGVPAARLAGCRLVLTARRSLGHQYTPTTLRAFRALNRLTTRVLANSEGAKRYAVKLEGVPAEKVDVLYNGVDMEAFQPRNGDPRLASSLGIPPEAKVVGIVANLRPVKDHALFLRAARVVSHHVPEAVFLLLGQGPLRRELGRLSAELGIAERVFFANGDGTVADYLRCTGIGCLSSHSEGFSNAILEYMASGLPVVATDVGGNREAIQHGRTGYVVAERTPEAFAAPLIDLLRHEKRRREMGRRALQCCRDHFEIGDAVRQHEEYYRALLNKARSAGACQRHHTSSGEAKDAAEVSGEWQDATTKDANGCEGRAP